MRGAGSSSGLSLGALGCDTGGAPQGQVGPQTASPAPPTSPAPAVAAPDERYVSLRIFPTQRPEEQEEALKAIASVVELKPVIVDEEKSVAAFLQAQCGDLPAPLQRIVAGLFREHNPALARVDTLAGGSKVVLPPCPRLDPGGAIRVTTGADVWSHLKGEMGAAGCDSKKEVARRSGFKVRCQSAACCEETDEVLKNVKAGQTLVIPFRASIRQWRLKEPNFDEESFRAQLERLPNCGVVDVAFSPRASLVEIIKVVSTADLGPASQECADAAGDEDSPIRADTVKARLDDNSTFQDQVDEKKRITNVIVADTGLVLTPAIRPFVSFTPSEETPNFMDDDNNGFLDDSYGFRAEWLRGPPDPLQQFQDSEHGTVVAGAIAGSSPET